MAAIVLAPKHLIGYSELLHFFILSAVVLLWDKWLNVLMIHSPVEDILGGHHLIVE